jgi:hypothetical protein
LSDEDLPEGAEDISRREEYEDAWRNTRTRKRVSL